MVDLNNLMESLNIKGKGNKYYCPFCENPEISNSPSFSVSNEKKILKCFGTCGVTFVGETGVIEFVSKIKRISKLEAARELGLEKYLKENPLDILMDIYKTHLFEEQSLITSKQARNRFSVRGIDINSVKSYPIGAFRPLTDEELKKNFPSKFAKQFKNFQQNLGDYFMTVHGYYNYETKTLVALKFIPFDNNYRTIKDKIRVYSLSEMKNSFFGPVDLFTTDEIPEKIYVTEGEFDALVLSSKVSPVIAFGGLVGIRSKEGLPNVEYVIVPDSFDTKGGFEVMVDYISALGDGKEYLVYDVQQVEDYEDPAQYFQSNDYLPGLEVRPEILIFNKYYNPDNIPESVENFNRLIFKLPSRVTVRLKELMPDDIADLINFTNVGDSLNSALIYEFLSKKFSVIYIEETSREEFVYIFSKDLNTISKVSLKDPNRVFSFFTTLLGEPFHEYLLNNIPMSKYFFLKKDGSVRKESDILKELKILTMIAIEKLKADAAKLGLKGKKNILINGIYFINDAFYIVGKDKLLKITSDCKIEKVINPVIDKDHIIIPSQDTTFSEFSEDDLDFNLDPAEVFKETREFFKKIIYFPKELEHQYSILALLTFYFNIFDVFKDRILWVMFSGDSGSAKTTTMKFFTSTSKELGMHKLVLNSTLLSSYTAAGLRQLLNRQRISVGLDEAEPEVLDKLMDDFRSMISADSKFIRGTSDQVYVEQETRFPAILSSIALPSKPQNLNRLLLIRFVRNDKVGIPWITAMKNNFNYEYQRKLAYKILSASFKVGFQVNDKSKRYEAEEFLQSLNVQISPRDIEALSVLISLATSVKCDINDIVKYVNYSLLLRKTPSIKDLIKHEILNIQLQVEGFGTISLGQIISIISENSTLQATLAKRGIVYDKAKHILKFPLVDTKRYLSYNIATISSYLSNDEEMHVELNTLVIKIKNSTSEEVY